MTPKSLLTLGCMHKFKKSKQNNMIITYSSSNHLQSFVHSNFLTYKKSSCISVLLCVRVCMSMYVHCDSLCLCDSIHIKYLSLKNVDDFPYLGSLYSCKADTDAEIHRSISSASGVMPDSQEESLWTMTSRWRTTYLQSSCSSHSSARGTNLVRQMSCKRQFDYLDH